MTSSPGQHTAMLELLCLHPVGVDECASVRRPCINNCSRAVGLYVCVVRACMARRRGRVQQLRPPPIEG